MKSTPPPPYSAGALGPRKPAAPSLRQLSRSLIPSRFHCGIFGSISVSTRRRTWLRSISCSSVKISRRIDQPPTGARILARHRREFQEDRRDQRLSGRQLVILGRRVRQASGTTEVWHHRSLHVITEQISNIEALNAKGYSHLFLKPASISLKSRFALIEAI